MIRISGTLKKILTLLAVGETKKLYWLIAAIIFLGLLDMVGVASIFPFLSVITNPGVIQSSSKLKWVYDRFGFSSQDYFIVAIGTASFLILLVGNIFRCVTTVAMVRFAVTKRYIISSRLLAQYLHEPYVFFLNRNSAELTTYLMSEVSQVVTGVLNPFMQVIGRIISVALILALLFIVNPLMAVGIMGITGGGYFIIYMFLRTKLYKVGEIHTKHSKRMYKVLAEAFGGIKDIKLLGKEQVFVDEYSRPARELISSFSWQSLIDVFPRYMFETISFGAILGIIVFFTFTGKGQQQVIPMVGLYALAAFRFMPSLQQIYREFTVIRATLPALEVVYRDFMDCPAQYHKRLEPHAGVLPFSKTIEFRSVKFQYPGAQDTVIENFDLVIKSNTIVGFVGGSGAGKTTIVDVLLGLLRPKQGALLVDGCAINDDNLRSWQANIGYVPQHIYLCDDTITRNIAFGLRDDEINPEIVQRAAKLANIHDFIVKELPHGYETEVGERGVRLSGGQRQRIGIARAMYHDPSLLVFDEATSALDGITEEIILEAIHKFAHKKTIILIAHRLSTVKECDVIYLLERGKIVAKGNYAELMANNQQFRQMAKVTTKENSEG